MYRKAALFAVIAAILLPAPLFAGGPAWLCLPIDGITADNERSCAALLTTKLDDKLSPYRPKEREVKLKQHKGQWYLMFFMGKDVALSEVEAALKGSGFSVPRDRLHLFGHVILDIDARGTPHKELVADLEKLSYVSVEKSEAKKDRLLVTVDMPYPADERGVTREDVGWDTFKRNDFSSDRATRSESPATVGTLPGLDTLRDAVTKHKASLKDIRWDPNYACRPLGGVAVPAKEVKVSARRATPK